MGNLEATVRAIVARGEQAAREASLSGNNAATLSGIQVVAVCGRNQKLAQELNSASWLPRWARVLATGFVNNMEEWMSASDVIVTKAGKEFSFLFFSSPKGRGVEENFQQNKKLTFLEPRNLKKPQTTTGPGTIAEAIVSGLPMLLNGFIPCQEHGNVSYVTSRGIGTFERDPRKISEILEAWLVPSRPKSGSSSPSSSSRSGGVSEELAAMRAALRPLRPRFKDALANIVDDLAELCRSGGRALVESGHGGHGLKEEGPSAAA